MRFKTSSPFNPGVTIIIFTCMILFYGSRAESAEAEKICILLTKDRHIKTQLGDTESTVGMIFKNHAIHVTSVSKKAVTIQFGYSVGRIDILKEDIREQTECPRDLSGYNEKLLNNNRIITRKKVTVYSDPDTSSAMGILEAGLRYPVASLVSSKHRDLWYRLALAGTNRFIRVKDVSLDAGIPVLNYHHILTDKENTNFRNVNTTISYSAFFQQMQWLHELGVKTLTVKELESWLNKRTNIPDNAVVLTFDDGLMSVHRYAWPVLSRFKMKATLFVITSRITKNQATWDPETLQSLSEQELHEMINVFSLQSHSDALHNAVGNNADNIYNYPPQTIEGDFRRSRHILERFDSDVFSLAWPYGSFSPQAEVAVRRAGFRMGFTIQEGRLNPGDNLLELKRNYLSNDTSRKELILLIRGAE